ncbi:50S ribosomal protein L4 [Candidatus Woesearchaeota archaeon]|nr:50S ribosomal protein L4 [Candidatus Woesearchaeota archaeon]
MKLAIFDTLKNRVGEVNLPIQFNEPLRADLIKRAVLALRSNKKQPYGSMKEAGKRASSTLSKRRRKYRGSYGLGISRTPRKVLSRRGTRMHWVGAFAPNTVGGRRAHPPKAEKKVVKKINKKERKKAMRIGISASVSSDLARKRGHEVPENYPFAIDKKFEELSRTKDVVRILKVLGLEKELERVRDKKFRAGKGKLRGRRYKTKKGPLIVVSKKCTVIKASKNIPGVETVEVKDINLELLAPGESPGRLTLWTASAIETLKKEKLFGG